MILFSRWMGSKKLTYRELAEKLDELAAERGVKLDWRQSIMDLLRTIELNYVPDARADLAVRLGYPGKADGSATMNIWLHGEIMQRLAENGGAVPDSLK